MNWGCLFFKRHSLSDMASQCRGYMPFIPHMLIDYRKKLFFNPDAPSKGDIVNCPVNQPKIQTHSLIFALRYRKTRFWFWSKIIIIPLQIKTEIINKQPRWVSMGPIHATVCSSSLGAWVHNWEGHATLWFYNHIYIIWNNLFLILSSLNLDNSMCTLFD